MGCYLYTNFNRDLQLFFLLPAVISPYFQQRKRVKGLRNGSKRHDIIEYFTRTKELTNGMKQKIEALP